MTQELCNYVFATTEDTLQVSYGESGGCKNCHTVHGGTSSIIVSHRADLVKIPGYNPPRAFLPVVSRLRAR